MGTRTRTDFQVESQKVKWDPKTVEIKTRSVEKTLEPLVHQVTTLVNHQRKHQKSGKSKKAHQLAREIDEATERLVVVGESIAQDFPEIREPMLEACKEARAAAASRVSDNATAALKAAEDAADLVKRGLKIVVSIPVIDKTDFAHLAKVEEFTGLRGFTYERKSDTMRTASREFADDPCASAKRSTMIRAARALLSAVTRLLCIADMADVYRLVATLKLVEDRLKELQDADNTDDLMRAFKNYGDDLMKLAKLSGQRQADLKDPKFKDEMAAARATLKKSSRMLLTTSKTFVRHPEIASAKHNRDFVMQQINDAVNAINGVAQGTGDGDGMPYQEIGALARALEDLLKMVNSRPADFQEKKKRMELEKQLDEILAGAARLADSSCTRDNTRDKIIAECNNVKQALQNLLDEALKHAKGKPNQVPVAKEEMQKKAKDLGKQLRKAIVDHVSDSFLETNVPLILLIEAAMAGNEKEVEECAVVFTEHAAKLEEVANLACSMSNNPEGVKMVRIAARQLHSLCPQVINAARTLAARPRSKVAKENMDVFREAWINQVKVLTEAVDDITTIDDFLAVSEAHILEDVNRCVKALQCGDPETLDRTAGAIRGREARVDNVVTAEMENFEAGPYTETVKRAVLVMRDNIMPQFAEHVNAAVDALNQDPQGEPDENAFIDAAQLVYEGIRDIRRAVMMRKKHDDESDDDEDTENQETYLQSIADAQERQRHKQAYEQLKAGGKVQFEIHSEGGDDPGVKGNGQASIVVNGTEYCPKRRGHNIVVLDEIGNVVATRTFDTQDPSEGMAMAKFLDEIPDEHIALIAVQDTTGKGVEKAEAALKRLGAVEPVDPGPKGSWAFAGFKGAHHTKNWVTQVTRPRYHGPAMISDLINTPAFDQGKVKIEISSEASDDPGYARIASIKVNSIERSPNGRGFNVVVLDAAGNYLTSKSFDTVDPQRGRAEGQKMAQFLDELPSERMVCIAALEATGDGMDEVKEALIRVGVEEPIESGNKGSFAFVGYTGPEKVVWLKQIAKPRGQGPAKIIQFIVTPEGAERLAHGDDIYSDYEPDTTAFSEDFERVGPLQDYDEWDKTLSKRSARSLMRALPEEEKAKITKLTEGLRTERNRLVTEISKWDERGNDVIVLAKKMCMIMMDMSDFTRGTGPLKTTMDVIRAAGRIAKCGEQINKLGTTIADQCPHSSTRNDLLAYLQRIALYSHQLTITARVKADVQMISGEVVVSGLDSATSLIQSAKNLMNAVILTVKSSYVASTKHRQKDSEAPVVTWKMKAPEKKPLIKIEDDSRRTVRSERSDGPTPIQALSLFQK